MVKASTEYKRERKADYGREKIEILYEDEWLVIINKPTGLLSVPYPGSRARTALSALEDIMRKRGTLNAKHHPFVVHRLDRDTSGVMMFALSEQAQQKIMNSWHQMVTERLYHAVAENPRDPAKLLNGSGLIDDPLAFNAYNVGFVPREGDRPSAVPARRGKKSAGGEESVYERNLAGSGENREFRTVPARTNYRVILRGPTHTLFELSLDTGKKNQIRAHLASRGYPLAGDENYRAHTDPFHRLALHARTLEFIHPYTDKKMKFQVPEPDDWYPYVERGDEHPETPVWEAERGFAQRPRSAAVKGRSRTRDTFSAKSARSAESDALSAGRAGSTRSRRSSDDEIHVSGRKLTRKDAAHMDFIQRGKSRGR